MRKTLAALPLLLALTLTGCGAEEGGGDDVASAGGTSSAAAPDDQLGQDEMGVRFAQCMRENGVDMADPEPGKGIQLKVGPDTPQETVQAALEACREFNPQENGSAKPDPKREAAIREFAQCMRDNGVEAFPDPEPGSPGIRITGEVGQDPDFQTAQQACQDVLAAAGIG
jgi:predicted small secreted protein